MANSKSGFNYYIDYGKKNKIIGGAMVIGLIFVGLFLYHFINPTPKKVDKNGQEKTTTQKSIVEDAAHKTRDAIGLGVPQEVVEDTTNLTYIEMAKENWKAISFGGGAVIVIEGIVWVIWKLLFSEGKKNV